MSTPYLAPAPLVVSIDELPVWTAPERVTPICPEPIAEAAAVVCESMTGQEPIEDNDI